MPFYEIKLETIWYNDTKLIIIIINGCTDKHELHVHVVKLITNNSSTEYSIFCLNSNWLNHVYELFYHMGWNNYWFHIPSVLALFCSVLVGIINTFGWPYKIIAKTGKLLKVAR